MFEPTHTIEDIVPDARGAFDELLSAAQQMGFSPSIGKNSAGRTCATQQALKGQGPTVTGAGMCRSFHVLGRALDIDISPSTCANYSKLGELWESWGGTWGGRWTQFGSCGDARHFQWSYGIQTVPDTVCPPDVTLEECEAIRADYLAESFGSSAMSRAGLGIMLGGLVVAGYLVWRAYAPRRA